MSTALLSSLCRANVGILSHKLALMDALISRHGASGAAVAYRAICPIVGASIGQHVRHSMDHLELAALVAASAPSASADVSAEHVDHKYSQAAELHYDLRIRGGKDESDIDEARKRIINVKEVLDNLTMTCPVTPHGSEDVAKHPVLANFILSADEGVEMGLVSTVGRELGFAAHHAIHHMALIKIIATNTAGLAVEDLPHEFGRAPSTVKHDRTLQ